MVCELEELQLRAATDLSLAVGDSSNPQPGPLKVRPTKIDVRDERGQSLNIKNCSHQLTSDCKRSISLGIFM